MQLGVFLNNMGDCMVWETVYGMGVQITFG